ncbi:MAG: response regulator transcription factor [Cyanobacteria bacterium]|nr:response regulator transcription factor [Cyanobacteriota bacterium]
MRQSLRIMLADDHETVRHGLRSLLATVPGIEIVHDAANGDAAIEAARVIAPDVLILDLSMPTDGLTVMRRLREGRWYPKIVVLTRFRELGYVRETMAAGASGYVLKHSPFEALRAAILAVAGGGQYLDPALWLSSALQQTPDSSDVDKPPSERGMAVLRRSVLGQTNKEIATSLEIAVKTVEVHKAKAMKRLGLESRAQVIRYAVLHGWFDEA